MIYMYYGENWLMYRWLGKVREGDRRERTSGKSPSKVILDFSPASSAHPVYRVIKIALA